MSEANEYEVEPEGGPTAPSADDAVGSFPAPAYVPEGHDGFNGSIQSTKIYKASGVIQNEEVEFPDMIEVPAVHPRALVGNVSVMRKLTINIGNYESVQISVHVSLPAYVTKEQLDMAYETAVAFADEKLGSEARKIRDQRKGN